MDTFVIPKPLAEADTQLTSYAAAADSAAGDAPASSDATVTDNSYEDENVEITIDTVQKYSSTIYIADIRLKNASFLKTALANDVFGRNIKETTSEIAENHNAIFAVNGDYYGFRNSGYVLRNGTLYRDSASGGGETEDLVINTNGDFSIVNESETAISKLDTDHIAQILSFGPGLIENGQITVDGNSEVSRSKSSNPRTAIGQVSGLHYIVVVSDGRTDTSQGLSLLELAQVLKERGCTTAYNLDGGGSSTMYFNGKVVNNPTDGKKMGEREVSDIVYIGY
jgi:exopolysaccharide biosynthesis protein